MELRAWMNALLAGGEPAVTKELARARLEDHRPEEFRAEMGRYLIGGDTALHVAAAAYRVALVRRLLAEGAAVDARNRHGDTALHAAAVGAPGAERWDPLAQAETIGALVAGGALVNALNKRAVAPLHVAVRTRSSAAVRALLEHGAEVGLANGSGSRARDLARWTTGKSGSGSEAARAEQRVILELIEAAERGQRVSGK